MSVTPSSMVSLGTEVPMFSLPDATGKMWSRDEQSSGILVVFICNHCPYVIHVADVLCDIHKICKKAHIEMVGINSNDVQSYPEDSPENMIHTANEYDWEFPYLFDESQDVAKQFQATCTPDVFLFDSSCKLYYRGQFDDSRPSSGTPDGVDLKDAISNMLDGNPHSTEQKPATGCNIKWK